MYKEVIRLKEAVENIPADSPDVFRKIMVEVHDFLQSFADHEFIIYDGELMPKDMDFTKKLLILLSSIIDHLKTYYESVYSKTDKMMEKILLDLDYAIEQR